MRLAIPVCRSPSNFPCFFPATSAVCPPTSEETSETNPNQNTGRLLLGTTTGHFCFHKKTHGGSSQKGRFSPACSLLPPARLPSSQPSVPYYVPTPDFFRVSCHFWPPSRIVLLSLHIPHISHRSTCTIINFPGSPSPGPEQTLLLTLELFPHPFLFPLFSFLSLVKT